VGVEGRWQAGCCRETGRYHKACGRRLDGRSLCVVTRVVFITQQFDPSHPALASTVPQVTALARYVDEVVIVADRIVPSALPPNARAHSFRARTKLGRGLRLLRAVTSELRGLSGDGVVIAHMCPVYAITVGPIVRLRRVPLLMWWVHWKIDLVVRTAELVCTRVVSVDTRSFPHATKKLVTVGQSIDVADIPIRPRAETRREGPLRVLAAGRYSPAKHLDTLLRAVRSASDRGAELRLDVYGPSFGEEGRLEREALERLAVELDLSGSVELHDSITRGEVMELLGGADLLVNNARGGADRIVYEAGASGLPVLASNPAHTGFLDPDAFFGRDDPEGLAERLVAVAALSPAERDEIGRRLRERVERENSVDSWSRGLLRAAGLEQRFTASTDVQTLPALDADGHAGETRAS
jgi:glycosyltransferase involved in cell wall biosynthesis